VADYRIYIVEVMKEQQLNKPEIISLLKFEEKFYSDERSTNIQNVVEQYASYNHDVLLDAFPIQY
jgi:hypothetical protein